MRNNLELEEKARVFATAAHSAVMQKRKYTGEDYINHPAETIEIIQKYSTNSISSEQVASLWLHDTREDCNITADLILNEFGTLVALYVDYLTDVSKKEDGNRAIRKAMDRDHIAHAPIEVKACKISDLISNSLSIVEHDPGFARKYLKEKAELLAVMQDADPGLLAKATEVLHAGMKKLGMDVNG